jgi:hypothetical protein
MVVRTTPVGGALAGAQGAASQLNGAAGGWIGYAQVVAQQSSITSVVDLTGLSVTVTVGASRRLLITGYVQLAQQASSGLAEMDIYEGSTQLARTYVNVAASGFAVVLASVVLTPSTGAHTYKLRALTSAGSLVINAEPPNPAYILVQDIGPA